LAALPVERTEFIGLEVSTHTPQADDRAAAYALTLVVMETIPHGALSARVVCEPAQGDGGPLLNYRIFVFESLDQDTNRWPIVRRRDRQRYLLDCLRSFLR
jgi:hypothetical protein